MQTEPVQAEPPADDADAARHDQEPQTQQIEIQVAPSIHVQLEYAAALTGQTPSGFVIEATRRAISDAMQPRQVIKLNTEQSRIVADLLLNPPDPPPALIEAMHEYDERVATQRAARSAADTRSG